MLLCVCEKCQKEHYSMWIETTIYNAISTKFSDFCLIIYASSEGSGESVHWHKLHRALVASKCNT